MDSKTLHFNEKSLHTKFGTIKLKVTNMFWTSLLSKKISKGQELKIHEVQSTSSCALHFSSMRSISL
jgi:hypothetical protein